MIDQKTVSALSEVRGDNLISFYIPTHRVAGTEKDRIRYKNMLSQVHDLLLTRGLTPPEADERLAEAKTKLDDESFWQHQSDCLAVFINGSDTQFYELPLEMEELYFIGDKFYISPLLPFAQEKDKFYLLALSQDEVKVCEGSRYTIAELEKNDDFPESLAAILAFYDPDKTQQHHDAGGTIYHGQGAGQQVEKARYEEYLRQVDKGVQTMACDNDNTPLVLYTTPELAGVYRNINTYSHLLEDFVEGNPEDEQLGLLHEKAWEVLADYYTEETEEALAYFEQKLANTEAAYNMDEIGPAAMAGRIETLYLVKNQEYWGIYDSSTHQIERHEERQADSQPLYHDMALATWQQGGEVRLVERDELPRSESNVNAIFRYALSPA